jgi:hypothetical protein
MMIKDRPRREDYPSGPDWIAVCRQALQAELTECRHNFATYRDGFISLENPSQAQAQEFRWMEWHYDTVVGTNIILTDSLEQYLRRFAPHLLED